MSCCWGKMQIPTRWKYSKLQHHRYGIIHNNIIINILILHRNTFSQIPFQGCLSLLQRIYKPHSVRIFSYKILSVWEQWCLIVTELSLLTLERAGTVWRDRKSPLLRPELKYNWNILYLSICLWVNTVTAAWFGLSCSFFLFPIEPYPSTSAP